MVRAAQAPISWFNAFGWECNAWLGANHPSLPVFLPQIFPGTHLELDRIWLSLRSHSIDPCSEPNNQRHQNLISWPQDSKSRELISLATPISITSCIICLLKFYKNRKFLVTLSKNCSFLNVLNLYCNNISMSSSDDQ